jgi:shikimate dehydrogenase
MIKAGVIGHPIGHSKSPLIHGYWLKHYGINGSYDRYDIPPENLEKSVKSLVDDGLMGFNVTLPHKQSILPLCNSLSAEAQKIGAVNTVTIQPDGTLHGHNTDAYGFIENINSQYPDINWPSQNVLVLGAGGAAQAILYALTQQNIRQITIANRTVAQAHNTAKLFQAEVIDWDNKQSAIDEASLIINTTSLGMTGQPALNLSLIEAREDTIVYDIVYNPLITPLLAEAKRNKLRIVTGIGMLLHQARPGFESWFGHFPEVTPELEGLILKA